MNNKHLSWNKEINNNFIIASRAYFLQVLPSGGVGWWGDSPSLTRSLFGGSRVGQWRCRGFRISRRWYVTVSARRTSTSVATWLRWRAGSTIPGRFFRDLTGAMILWWFLIFACPPPASIPVGRYGSSCTSDAILVIIFDDVRTHGDDVVLLIIECILIWILLYFAIWFCLLNAQIGKLLLLWMLKLESTMQGVCIWLVDSL